MTTSNRPESAQPTPAAIDWREVARSAFGSAFFAGLVGGALHVLAKVIEAEMQAATAARNVAPKPIVETPPLDFDLSDCEDDESEDDGEDDEEAQAAALLGVQLDASEDTIRAALRAKLTHSRLHPDHGGDGEEAKRLIAAKNLLVARVRSAQSPEK